MLIERNWTWVGLFGLGAFATGFSLAVIALVQLRPEERDNFEETRRKQLYITAWVYIGFVIAIFLVAMLVALANRNHNDSRLGMNSDWTSRTTRTTYSSGNHPAIF